MIRLLKGHFHTIQSISKHFTPSPFSSSFKVFPYYLVYFKAFCPVLIEFLEALISILFSLFQSARHQAFRNSSSPYFHTIQSISKPEYSRYQNMMMVYFHTIQSISKQLQKSNFFLKKNNFHTIQSISKHNYYRAKKKIQQNFHTIQSISKPAKASTQGTAKDNFHTIQSISKHPYPVRFTYPFFEFPYYLVYFKAFLDGGHIHCEELFPYYLVYFKARNQILLAKLCERDFHTIQSISKQTADDRIGEKEIKFPYYLVYFKAADRTFDKNTIEKNFHTIQSISKL